VAILQGFKNLYTLEKGIQNYLKQKGSAMWKGSLFVFDGRMAVAPGTYDLLRAISPVLSQALFQAFFGMLVPVMSLSMLLEWALEVCVTFVSVVFSSGDQAAAGELPAAASCQLCGGKPELPHENCANIDCNKLFLACAGCKVWEIALLAHQYGI
jgi:hypothetical protein